MSNVLEFYLKMKDMMSSGIAAVARNARTGFGAVSQAINNVQNRINSSVTANNRLSNSYSELQRRIMSVTEKMHEATDPRRIETYRRALDRLNRQSNNHAGNNNASGGGLGSLVGGAAIGYGASQIVGQSLQQAAAKENALISYKVLTGSKAFGDRLYGDIVKMADATPFESGDLNRAAKTQLGYGVNKKDIMPNLKMFGDIASAQDNPAEALQSISLAFGQISAKGHLAGQEVLQLVNAGFNPLKEISDMTGKSMNDLDKSMAKGEITVQMVKDAFAHATSAGGKFSGMMEEQSKTLGGQYSTFMDLVHSKLRALGTFLSPLAKGVMSFGSALMNNKWALAAMGIALVALSVIMVSAAVTTGVLKTAITALGTAVTANPVTIWIAAIGAGIALLLPLFDSLNNKADDINSGFSKLTKTTTMMADINSKASAVAGESISKARLLMAAVRDNTLAESIRATKLQELKNIQGGFFDQFDLNTIKTDKATNALNNYTDAVIQHSTAMAAADKYKEIEGSFIDTQLKNHEQMQKAVYGGDTALAKQMGLTKKVTVNAGHESSYEKDVLLTGAEMGRAGALWEYKNNQAAQVAKNTSQNFLKGIMDKDKNSPLAIAEAKADKVGTNAEAEKVGKSVASGGPRVINISGVKFMDKLEMHVANVKDGINNVEVELEDMFLRILNSGASVQ